jgi:hypothetical protein
MGFLTRFNLSQHEGVRPVFIETGTANGDSLLYATRFQFEFLYSIEIDAGCAQNAAKRFEDDERVMVLCGSSSSVLPKILYRHKEPIVFWLDAHFPGEMRGLPYDHEKNMQLRLPLEQELAIIREHRDVSKDFFIIDDLRIYEDGPFTNGNWRDRKTMGGDGIDFITKMFGATHTITRNFMDEGYILLEPKCTER